MNPTPKRRRSHSPITPPSLGRDRLSGGSSQHRPASPANPTLPPPIPSYPVFAPPPAAGPGPSTWQSWRGPERGRSRHSMDARSQGSDDMMSPRMEALDEIGEVVFTRDTSNRAPRSMMACTRCRRQKMKCDGPSQVPCRGCRQSGSACIFEARSRPKSISTIPNRSSSFYSSGPGMGSPAPPGFYPPQPTAAPPLTSRHTPGPAEPPAFRQAREPMPPPVGASIGALTSPHPRAHSPTTVMAAPSAPPLPPPPPPPSSAQPPPSSSYYHPHPLQLAPMPSAPHPPATPNSESSRIRAIETSLRPLQSLPHQVNSIQQTVAMLQRGQESLLASFPRLRARETPADVPEPVWESYRARAWPLTPWLVGLREAPGLPSLVISVLGKRTLADRAEERRRDTEDATKAVYEELGRLVAERVELSREEIRALGAFSTWVSDPALACMTVGQARALSLDRVNARRGHDDWREWIYLSIMDKITHVVDFKQPVTHDVLAPTWRDRLQAGSGGDPAIRDRDMKLLAWLEYAEILTDVFQAQTRPFSPAGPSDEGDDDGATDDKSSPVAAHSPKTTATTFSGGRPSSDTVPGTGLASGGKGPGSAGQASTSEDRDLERRRAMSVWKKFAGKIEAWAGSWSVRTDPILSLHFNYAVLVTASPLSIGGPAVWAELSSTHEGFQQLERGRDAAFAVIQAICSQEIGRTLTYSFSLYRPLLGLALAHLISLALALPPSPMISQTHVLTVLRSTYDAITAANPLDIAQSLRPDSRDSRPGDRHHTLLAEMVLGSKGLAAGKEILNGEPGRDMWRMILG